MIKKKGMKIMLELMKSYTKPEMSAMFGTRSMQGLQRKIERYGVSFDVDGRGKTANFTITNIENPFKIYCITELGFDGHTDFYKLRNYYYYYFNDIEFRAMPNEVQENRMRLVHKDVSRQTIANYLQKLYRRNLIELNTNNFTYYFAFKDRQRIVEKEEYIAAIKALDRILLHEHYLIPQWYSPHNRVAYHKGLKHPQTDFPAGFNPYTWWREQ